MRYIVEFDAQSEIADNASEGIYKALVSVLEECRLPSTTSWPKLGLRLPSL